MRRPYLAGCPQHIIQRGNNREACFLADDDCASYLRYLEDAANGYEVAIHAFVLMTNHVHLLATPANKDGISRMMQALGRRYVQYFNHTYQRTGTLWEGRYKSTLVDSETYLFTVYRYIELNPVRANMVKHASQYIWSSYQYNGAGRTISLITPHPEYVALGDNHAERQSAYRDLFKGRMPQWELQSIRDATNRAWVLGSEQFKRNFESKTGRPAHPRQRDGDRKSSHWRNQRLWPH
nr:transposase [Gilvimarinus xylanilyticus]